jgi:hypothetical protein
LCATPSTGIRAPGSTRFWGIFNVLAATSFPTLASPFFVFLVLTGIRSPTAVSLRVVALNAEDQGEEVLWDTPELELTGRDPLALTELAVRMEGLVLPAPGEYRIHAIWDGESIAEKRVVAQGV